MESNNTFQNGMNSDISKVYHSKDSYLQALNFRPIGDLGESHGSLVTVKGNECAITYPRLDNVYKLRVEHTGVGTTIGSCTLIINGQSATFDISSATTGSDLYNIVSSFSNCYNNPSSTNPSFAIAYSNLELVIYQLPNYSTCSPGSVISMNVSVTYNSGDYKLQYVTSTGVLTNTKTAYIPTITNTLITIGSTFIQEDIYLFTCPDDPSYTESDTFNDSFTKPGQIWKLTINDITKEASIVLLYNSYLDFTKYHPIPPSATTGRYENGGIKRIYFSDFFNKIRSINVADEQLMALDPSQSSVTPTLGFSQMILDNVISGSLKVGAYQAAYRLSKNFGSVSNISELSNIFYLPVGNTNGTSYTDFLAIKSASNGTNSSKGLRYKVSNLDLNFDQVEFFIAFRDTQTGVPIIKVTTPTVIPTSGEITVDFTDLSDTSLIDVTLDDFITLSGIFTHAKTCDTKDNRLFWGNVKIAQKDINFDARAFRAKTSNSSSTDIILTNQSVSNSPGITLSQAIALTDTNDCINEYYDINGDPSVNGCYYKPNTAGNILGGKGLNISYEFATYSIQLDNAAYSGSTSAPRLASFAPFRVTDTAYTANSGSDIVLTSAVQSPYLFNQRGTLNSMKTTYKSGLLKGYQHEEIYRFGIQFFDLEGNPYFVKWIGDIKMPSYHDYNNNVDSLANAVGISDFRLSFTGADGRQYGQILYVKFNVDVSSVQSQISGYQIVRVRRTANDETILGTGALTTLYEDGSDPNQMYLPSSYKSLNSTLTFTGSGSYVTPPFVVAGKPHRVYPSVNEAMTLHRTGNRSEDKYITFDSYDFHYSNGYQFKTGDKLLYRGLLSDNNFMKANKGFSIQSSLGKDISTNDVPGVGVSPWLAYNNSDNTQYDNDAEPYFILKFSEFNSFTNQPSAANNYGLGTTHNQTISNSTYVNSAQTATIGSKTFNNWGRDFGLQSADVTIGSNTQLIELSNQYSIDTNYGPISPGVPSFPDNTIKMIALYYRPNSNQYDGNTYNKRSTNTYMTCSEYVPVVNNKLIINTNVTDLSVMNGDVYMCYYDMQKAYKGTGVEYNYFKYQPASTPAVVTIDNALARWGVSFFFPCTNKQNSELDYGAHPNVNLTGDFAYSNDTYSNSTSNFCENDIKQYYPKPAVFNNTNEWINRIYYSEIKYNGETQDSWSIYKTDNYHDAEGNYGAINAIVALRDKLHFIQDRAFGVLLINPVSIVPDQNGQSIKLGTGNTIERHDYYSIDSGTKHQWSVSKSQNSISFVDIRQNKIYLFNGESLIPISDNYGQRNFVNKRLHNILYKYDNPVISKGILSTYDYLHNEFLYSFTNLDKTTNTTHDAENNEFYTIAYSEQVGKFTSLYSFVPNIYVSNNKYLLSMSKLYTNKLYLHNYGNYGTFYDLTYDSMLKLIINDNPKYTKVFDNLSWVTESIEDNIEWNDDYNIYPGAPTYPIYPDNINYQNDTFKEIRVYNDYQNSDWVILDPITTKNIRRVERSWNIQVPRNKFNYDTVSPSTQSLFNPLYLTKKIFGERIRDKYMIIDLLYDNALNNRFIVHFINSLYRISDR